MTDTSEPSSGGETGGRSRARSDGATAEGPSTDALFRLLANRHRRYALACLEEHETMTLADLADEVAVTEHGLPIDRIPAQSIKEIYVHLYHTHVPKLEAANMVEYDQQRDMVTGGEALAEAVPYLALVEDEWLETE